MVRAFVLYESEPDAEHYRQHIDEFASKVDVHGVPAREDLRVAVRRAEVPLLRRVRVGRHGVVQGPRRTRRRSPHRARTRWRWASRSPCTSPRSSRSDRADPPAPARSGGARLRVDRLREGAAARDDQAQPAGCPERVRLPHAARDRPRLRGRVLGRRRARGRGDRHRARVLRRRRPPLLGRGLPREAEGVLEVVRRLQGRPRPAARDRQADDRADQRDRGRRRERAADGVRSRRDGRHGLHPSRRSRARLGPCGRRDPVAAAHGRRPARAGDRLPVRRGFGCAGRGVGARQPGGSRGGAGRGGRRAGREARSQASADDALREAAAQRLARLRLAPDGRPRARLARDLDDGRRGAGRRARVPRSDKGGSDAHASAAIVSPRCCTARPSLTTRSGAHDHAQPARGLQRVQPRATRRVSARR